MIDDTLDTLTTIEAKILQERYGIGDLNDPTSSFRTARLCSGNQIRPLKNVTDIAREMDTDSYQVCLTELQARRKLTSAN